MKTSWYSLLLALLVVMHTGCAGPSFTDGRTSAAREAAVQSAILSKSYSFKAVSASTQKGRNINLTSVYSIVVKPDLVSCDLPFFGTSFSGGSYGGDGGIRFESTQFEYKQEAGKKGSWEVTIMPKDKSDVQKLILMIGTSGYTNVTVISTNRSAMHYFGNIEVPK